MSSSGINQRLLLTKPITRTAIAEAVVEYLVLHQRETQNIPGRGEIISTNGKISCDKAGVFCFIKATHPEVSFLSFDKAWNDVENELAYTNGFNRQFSSNEAVLEVRVSDLGRASDSLVSKLRNCLFSDLDKKDQSLAHLFEKELPVLSPVPRMDINGRVQTDVGEKLQQLVEILEPLQGPMASGVQALVMSTHQSQLMLQELMSRIDRMEKAGLPAKQKPWKEMTMSEKLVKAATDTSTGVLAAIQEGGKISVSQKANRGVVTLFHKHLGKHIPGATSPIGQKIEAVAIPGLLHFAAAALADKVPHVDIAQRACLRAITGESKDGMDDVLEVLLPLFQEIISSEGSGLIGEALNGYRTAEVEQTQVAPAQLAGHDTRALAESLATQLKDVPVDEPFEIVIRRAPKEEELKPLVPPTPGE